MHLQTTDYKRSIGYDFSEWGSFEDVQTAVPRVRWLRVDMASATPRSAAPHQILDSYNAWVAWRDNARQVPPAPLSLVSLCLKAAFLAQFLARNVKVKSIHAPFSRNELLTNSCMGLRVVLG